MGIFMTGLFGAGMGVGISFAEAFLGDVGVNLGRGKGSVSEKGLNRTEVGTVV